MADDGKTTIVEDFTKLEKNKQYTIYLPSYQTTEYYISQKHDKPDKLRKVIEKSGWIRGEYKGLNEFGKHKFYISGIGDVPLIGNYIVFEGVRMRGGRRRRSQRRRRNQRKTRRLL